MTHKYGGELNFGSPGTIELRKKWGTSPTGHPNILLITWPAFKAAYDRAKIKSMGEIRREQEIMMAAAKSRPPTLRQRALNYPIEEETALTGTKQYGRPRTDDTSYASCN